MGSTGQKGRSRRKLDDNEWLQFWRHGSVTTFERRGNPNYDGEIRQFWERQFAALSPGSRVVDLATGNGAVALLAAEYSSRRGMQFEIEALDKAAIAPRRDLKGGGGDAARQWLNQVHFRGNAPNERTSVDSRSVDLLTSQYGFEYGEPAASAREAMRILKPGGRIALVTHHVNSVVVREAREGLEQHRFCLDRERLLEKAGQVVEAMSGASSRFERRLLRQDGKAEHLRRKLNASVERVRQHAARYRDPGNGIGLVLHGLSGVFAPDLNPSQRRAAIQLLRESCAAYRRRMEDLLAATPSAEQFDRLLDCLRSAGIAIEGWFPLIYRGEALMGWAVAGNRPAEETASVIE